MDSHLKRLSVDERIRLVEDLWDSIAADQNALPLTPEQRIELDRRLNRFDDDAAATRPAAEAIARIRKRL
jgi:putative addiction module component (TIGR02574 family)